MGEKEASLGNTLKALEQRERLQDGKKGRGEEPRNRGGFKNSHSRRERQSTSEKKNEPKPQMDKEND